MLQERQKDMEVLVDGDVVRGMEEEPDLRPHGRGSTHLSPQAVAVLRGGGSTVRPGGLSSRAVLQRTQETEEERPPPSRGHRQLRKVRSLILRWSGFTSCSPCLL